MTEKQYTVNAPRWSEVKAPSLEDFENLARQALDDLPEPFAKLAQDVTVRIADFAEPEALQNLDIESPFELLGLFVGQGLSEGGASPESGQLHNAIWLYRRPILDYWAEHDETLGAIVRHVFIHEMGHHMGLSDNDMERIEQQAD